MKKLLAVLLAFGVLSILVAGCAQSAESAPATDDKAAAPK